MKNREKEWGEGERARGSVVKETEGERGRMSIMGVFTGAGWACNGTGSRSMEEALLRPFVGVMTLGFSIIKILSPC